MRKYLNLSAAAFLALLLLASGCGESEAPEQDVSDSGTIVIQDSEPVAGWLEVVLPGSPLAIDGFGEQVWILTDTGAAMGWNASGEGWSSIEAAGAFDIAVSDPWIAILSPGGLTVYENGEMTEHAFGESQVPLSVCASAQGPAVLFEDGSVEICRDGLLSVALETSGAEASGELFHENGLLAWMNQTGTASVLNMDEGLVTETILPEGTSSIALADGILVAAGENGTSASEDGETWEPYCSGTVSSRGLVCSPEGITDGPQGELLTSGMASPSEEAVILEDGTVWCLAENGVTVWAEIGSVETRLPDADVQRLTYRMAGQTGQGTGSGAGVSAPEASLGGVFRIYESVSSRPDPFTEFPAASRDLRRPLEDLTIEELHLVGITIDPAGGDQAMVEDANGVAYVLREGTVLRNNTRIAEITGNEVIVVQEVTVGSEDDLGGTTSIPTIFSMRLHEEGGL